MRWPWQARYDKDAVETSSVSVQALLRQALGVSTATVITRDENYLRLDEDRLKDFVWKHWDPKVIYHSNGPDFPDCDDFADMAKGAIIYGAVLEGFRHAPVFGEITYKTRRTGGWHRANWAITNRGRVLIFEPQSMDWRDLRDEVEEVRSAEL